MDDRSGERVLTEPEIVQNPAFGAYIIWQFGIGFQAEAGGPPPLQTLFIVLPVLLDGPTLNVVKSTLRASGLTLFASKLSDRREVLLSIHDRALMLRPLTLESIGVGISKGLLSVQYDVGLVRSNTLEVKPRLPDRLKYFGACAEKLGAWCGSAGLAAIGLTLRVTF